jgi:hypothetical protein
MTNSAQRIDPVLVEKAVLALVEVYGSGRSDLDTPAVEAALRVVFDELGLKEERRYPAIPIPGEGTTRPGPATHTRYVSEWRLVEQGDAE